MKELNIVDLDTIHIFMVSKILNISEEEAQELYTEFFEENKDE